MRLTDHPFFCLKNLTSQITWHPSVLPSEYMFCLWGTRWRSSRDLWHGKLTADISILLDFFVQFCLCMFFPSLFSQCRITHVLMHGWTFFSISIICLSLVMVWFDVGWYSGSLRKWGKKITLKRRCKDWRRRLLKWIGRKK